MVDLRKGNPDRGSGLGVRVATERAGDGQVVPSPRAIGVRVHLGRSLRSLAGPGVFGLLGPRGAWLACAIWLLVVGGAVVGVGLAR